MKSTIHLFCLPVCRRPPHIPVNKTQRYCDILGLYYFFDPVYADRANRTEEGEQEVKSNVFESMEAVISKHLSKRQMEKAWVKGELEKAARSLAEASTVLIVTGFVIRDTMTGETDGPPGAVALAGALETMGKSPVIITDRHSAEIVMCGLRSRGISTPVEIVSVENTGGFCDSLLERYRPSHLIAVERPGRARDGRCYSMRGEDLSDIVPDTDLLFHKAAERGMTTIAVGDGGNEVGMGKVKAQIECTVSLGDKICAEFAADYLIVASVSNWGAYALVAAMSLLSQKKLLGDPMKEIRVLASMVQAGAVDGCTKKNMTTVDGFSLRENLCTYKAIWEIVTLSLENSTNSIDRMISNAQTSYK